MFAACISESLRSGFQAGPRIVWGHGIAEISLVALLAFGLAPILEHSALARGIGLIGGALMFWMGIDLLRNAPHIVRTTGKEQTSPQATPGQAVRAGILTSVANPYFYIWWSSIGLAFILRGKNLGWSGLSVFYTGHILSDLVWYSAVAFAVSRGRQIVRPVFFRRLLWVCGIALCGFGLRFMLGM